MTISADKGPTTADADGDTTLAVTLVGTTSGASVAVLVLWDGTTTTFSSVDIGGQAGTVQATTLGSSGTIGRLQFATLDSLSSGGDKTVTATMSASVASGRGLIVAWSFNGTNTSGVFDKGNSAAASGLPSLSLTTVADHCHIIAGLSIQNSGSTAGANYTLVDLADKDFFNTSERDTDFDAGTAGAKTVNFATLSDTYALSALALKPSAGGGAANNQIAWITA